MCRHTKILFPKYSQTYANNHFPGAKILNFSDKVITFPLRGVIRLRLFLLAARQSKQVCFALAGCVGFLSPRTGQAPLGLLQPPSFGHPLSGGYRLRFAFGGRLRGSIFYDNLAHCVATPAGVL